MAIPGRHPSNLYAPKPGHPRARVAFSVNLPRPHADDCTSLDEAPGPLHYLFSSFPELARRLGRSAPVVVETRSAPAEPLAARPVRTGACPDAFSRAMEVCRALDRSAVLCGLPLTLLNLLLQHGRRGSGLPPAVLLMVEGHCPLSLEEALLHAAGESGARARLAHLYGVEGLGGYLMASAHRTQQGRPLYRAVHPKWRPGVYRGQLGFIRVGERRPLPFLVEEDACRREDGFLLVPLPKRLAPQTLAVLEQWSVEDWRRRTGFLARAGERFIYQLRPGVMPSSPAEIDFEPFSAAYPFSWDGPPDWGAPVCPSYRRRS